jgi:hypothetical protein
MNPTSNEAPVLSSIADLVGEPKKATLYTLTISSLFPEQQQDYDKMFFNDKVGRSHAASKVLHDFIRYHGIPWSSTRIIHIEHHRHGDGKNGHFIIEALVQSKKETDE